MATQWIVLFDSQGVDALLPWSDLKADDMLEILSGRPSKEKSFNRINMMIVRARANPQRFPEVWAYDTDFDVEVDGMRQLWEDNPQYMADLVRSKGTALYRTSRPDSVIV